MHTVLSRSATAQEGQDRSYPFPDSIPRMYDAPHFAGALTEDGPDRFVGPVRLSTSSAHFAKLAGTMRLAFVDTAPANTPAEFLAGARVYRVLNADEFYARNKASQAFCGAPFRWIALKAVDRSTIRLTTFYIRDWRMDRDDKLGECSSLLFQRRDDPDRR
jgi:hypothetical protein